MSGIELPQHGQIVDRGGGDHAEIRAAIANMLAPHFDVVAMVADGQAAVEAAAMRPVPLLTQALIWTSDGDKRYTYVNTAWTAFTGRALEAVLADGWRESIHPDDLPQCLEVIDAAFEVHQ